MLVFLLRAQNLAALVSHSLYSSKDRYANAESRLYGYYTGALAVLEYSSKNHQLGINSCVSERVRADMENRRREEFVGVLPWPTSSSSTSSSSSSPPALYSLFLRGAVSLPGVGSAPPQ